MSILTKGELHYENTGGQEPTPEQWEDLANAIIIRAAFDYREVRVALKEIPNDYRLIEKLKSIERFFLSEWYRQLTTVDGRYILRRLKNEPIGWSPVKCSSQKGADT